MAMQGQLQFEINAEGNYECIIDNVEHSFNLHLEREKPASVDVLVCTPTPNGEAKYDVLYSHYCDATVDKDFKLLVFPKTVKVVSWQPVANGVMTFAENEGGGGGGGQIIVPGMPNSVLYDNYDSATSDGPTS